MRKSTPFVLNEFKRLKIDSAIKSASKFNVKPEVLTKKNVRDLSPVFALLTPFYLDIHSPEGTNEAHR